MQRLILQDIPAADELGIITVDALVRFARACAVLPQQTPKPFFNIGDDETIGAEWDLAPFHIEIQVGNDDSDDAILFEIADEEPVEIPLGKNLVALAAVMKNIISSS